MSLPDMPHPPPPGDESPVHVTQPVYDPVTDTPLVNTAAIVNECYLPDHIRADLEACRDYLPDNFILLPKKPLAGSVVSYCWLCQIQ